MSHAQFPLQSNWELSTAGATAVVSLLIERHGFDALLVSAAGYSEYRPVEDNGTPAGWAANRRIALVVVGNVPDRTDWPGAKQFRQGRRERLRLLWRGENGGLHHKSPGTF